MVSVHKKISKKFPIHMKFQKKKSSKRCFFTWCNNYLRHVFSLWMNFAIFMSVTAWVFDSQHYIHPCGFITRLLQGNPLSIVKKPKILFLFLNQNHVWDLYHDQSGVFISFSVLNFKWGKVHKSFFFVLKWFRSI